MRKVFIDELIVAAKKNKYIYTMKKTIEAYKMCISFHSSFGR